MYVRYRTKGLGSSRDDGLVPTTNNKKTALLRYRANGRQHRRPPLKGSILKDSATLREEAARSRRLANDVADRRLQANLREYAKDLEERAARMDGAMNSRGVVAPDPEPAHEKE
jgi:hypothetical protein